MAKHPSRRELLRSALMIGGGSAAFCGAGPLTRLADAEEAHPDAPQRFYIFCYFGGGWDTLLSLDPRDPAVFTEENVPQTLIQPGYDRLVDSDGQLRVAGNGMVFGPHIGDLADHAERLAIVRGMSMETLTHEAGRRRFLTGKPPSGLLARGSSAATWLASSLGGGEPIPNLALRVESYNVDQPVQATGMVVNSLADLLRVLRPADPALDALEERQLDELLRNMSGCSGAQESTFLQQAEMSRRQVSNLLAAQVGDRFDLAANTDEMIALRDHYAIAAGSAALSTPEAHAAMAAQAIMGGVSRCVSVEIARGLDTHDDAWEDEQGPTQERGFNAVARLIEDLAGREFDNTGSSWLDHTTIVGFSEFSRTSRLNVRGGRDHSLTNAAFVAGGGIAGGRVIGQSSDIGMEPQPVNLATGELDPDGEVPKPEHVIQSLFDEVGISAEGPDLRVSAIGALLR